MYMEPTIFIGLALFIYWCNMLIAWLLAWFITEVLPIRIPVKPFNCRGCLSFWLTFAPGAVIGYNLTDDLVTAALLTAVAFLTGIINYLYIKLKFRIYE